MQYFVLAAQTDMKTICIFLPCILCNTVTKPCNAILLFHFVFQRNWHIKIYFAYLPPFTNFMLYYYSCRTGIISHSLTKIPFLIVLAVKSLSFCLSENVFTSPSFLNEQIQNPDIPPCTLKMPFPYFLASYVSNKKYTYILIMVSLCVMDLLCFPLAFKNIFPLNLWFSTV